MYNATITVFNYYESNTAKLWYPHVLSGVDLITDKGQMLKKYGPNSIDNAELHIKFVEKKDKKIIIDSSGKELLWSPPKSWQKQTNDEMEESITFDAGEDFFFNGIWEGGYINDDDYADRRYPGFQAYMANTYDYVYLITSVGGPYSVIPHFEILGK